MLSEQASGRTAFEGGSQERNLSISMEILNSIPLFTVRDREQARPVPALRSMYGTGSSAFPTNQKERQAETRQAHRHTMEAQLRRDPEAIRILPVLHREARILPEEMLPETETIQAAAMLLVEATIPTEVMAITLTLETAMQAPATQIVGMALQLSLIHI